MQDTQHHGDRLNPVSCIWYLVSPFGPRDTARRGETA
jgi:hypothetical protein